MIYSGLEGQEFINGKILMTEDKGQMFVVYTVIAVVHMIHSRQANISTQFHNTTGMYLYKITITQ